MLNQNQASGPNGFDSLNVGPELLKVLGRLGFTEPTPIQAAAIPPAIEFTDIIGIAQTGTGKTLAFGIPLVQHLMGAGRTIQKGPRALILAPTRELALQIEESLLQLCKPVNLSTCLLVGGAPIYKQFSRLRARPDIIIATPGRLEDHLRQNTIRLDSLTTLILDEADRMLDMGFSPAIIRIAQRIPENRQTMLFSATFPNEIEQLAQNLLQNPQRIEIESEGTAADNVTQELFVMKHEDKHGFLHKILEGQKGPILVFARTRHGARKLAMAIRDMNHYAAEIHSDRTLAQRREALEGFKNGRYAVLVATDIASRGIDVKSIQMVVNFDLPDQAEDYIHRIGRTGRAGESGRSVTFATPQQKRELLAVERILKHQIPLSEDSPMEMKRPEPRPRTSGEGYGDRSAPRGGERNGERGERPSRVDRKVRTRITKRFVDKEIVAIDQFTAAGSPEAGLQAGFSRISHSSESTPVATSGLEVSNSSPIERTSESRGGFRSNPSQGRRYEGRSQERPSHGGGYRGGYQGGNSQGGNSQGGYQGNGYQGRSNDRPSSGRGSYGRPYGDRPQQSRYSNDRPAYDNNSGGNEGYRGHTDRDSNQEPRQGGYSNETTGNRERGEAPWGRSSSSGRGYQNRGYQGGANQGGGYQGGNRGGNSGGYQGRDGGRSFGSRPGYQGSSERSGFGQDRGTGGFNRDSERSGGPRPEGSSSSSNGEGRGSWARPAFGSRPGGSSRPSGRPGGARPIGGRPGGPRAVEAGSKGPSSFGKKPPKAFRKKS